MFTVKEAMETVLFNKPVTIYSNDFELPESQSEREKLNVKKIEFVDDSYHMEVEMPFYKSFIGKPLQCIPMDWILDVFDKNGKKLFSNINMEDLYRYSTSFIDMIDIISIKLYANKFYAVSLNCEMKL